MAGTERAPLRELGHVMAATAAVTERGHEAGKEASGEKTAAAERSRSATADTGSRTASSSGVGKSAVTSTARNAVGELVRRSDTDTESEQLIVVQLINETADATMVHLPAPTRRVATTGATRAFANMPMPANPYKWVSVCGLEGIVYLRGGSFTRSPICPACEAAGVAPPVPAPTRRAWSRADCLEALRRWADEHDGVAPTTLDWKKGGDYWPSFTTIYSRLGCWGEALEAAGLTRAPRRTAA